jgi:hypothetical protein
MLLAKKARPVARLAKKDRKAGINIFSNDRGIVSSTRISVTAFRHTGKNTRSVSHTDRSRNEHILKSNAVSGKPVYIRRFDKRMPRASKRVITLIIHQDK